MKIKLFLSTLLSFVFCLLSSQVPQGFNYQAIVRDGVTKQPVVSQPVLIRITIEDGIGTDLYQETHSLSTDEFGIILIIIGRGTPWGTSDFEDLDWNDEPLSIKTEVQYPVGGSYTEMGTAPLMSVPYAMVADSLGGPLKNLRVKGAAATPDNEALFEVKNTTGQTVFAVYNEGVRIYVNDIDAKGAKGGFAIGGFGMGKTIPHEYLFISGDSVRVYIDNSDADKGPKGGFAIGGFGAVKGLNQKYMMVSNDSVRIYVDNTDDDKGPKGGFAIGGYGTAKGKPQDLLVVNNDSVRIYIDNQATDKGVKGGFAIGGYGTGKGLPQKLLAVSNDSVRVYIDDSSKGPKGGFAIGGFDKVKGEGNNKNFFNVATSADDTINPAQNRILWYPLKNAFLAGNILIEHPDSVGINSFSSGYLSRAMGSYSQAMGYQATARGWGSTAIGYNSFAGGQAFAFGAFSEASDRSFAFGIYSVAKGYNSFSIGGEIYGVPGTKTNATAESSMAIGFDSQAYGKRSLAIGISDTTKGQYSFSFGYKTSARSNYSTAIGRESTANGMSSVSMGYRTYTSGEYSLAMGFYTQATGTYSTAMGTYTVASGGSSTAFGGSTTASGDASAAFGGSTTASGTYSLATGSYTVASGRMSTALGWYTNAQSGCEVVLGSWNTSYTPLSIIGWNPADRLFVIGNGTSTLTSNAMTVLKNGRIGLQTVTSPTYALELPNNTDNGIGRARANAWATYSDKRAKSDFEILKYGLSEIMLLTPRSYIHHITPDNKKPEVISPEGKYDIGLIAQEVYNIIPEAVFRPEDEGKDLWSMSYDKLVPVLIKAIQEQQQQIENQQKEMDALKAMVNSLIAIQPGNGNN